jgi:hypothetical protein
MPENFQVQFVDDFDNNVTATVPGAPGQAINLPPGWISVSWTDYGNPQQPQNMGPLFFGSQQTADAAQAKGFYP